MEIKISDSELRAFSKKSGLLGKVARVLLRIKEEQLSLEQATRAEEDKTSEVTLEDIALKIERVRSMLLALEEQLSKQDSSMELEEVLRITKRLDFKSFKGGY